MKNNHRVHTEIPTAVFCREEKNLPPGARYGPVIRDVYVFECCTAGKGSVIVNGKEYFFEKGDFYVLFPGDAVTQITDRIDPREGIYCIALGLSLRHLLARAGITSRQPFAPRSLFPVLVAEMEKMSRIDRQYDPGAESRRTACLYQILGELLRHAQDTDHNSLIQKAVGVMETRYHENISVEKLSAEIGLERSYFSVLFRQRTGLPPHRYLTRLRIQKACALMKQQELSVAEIAESVGLDPQNFSRLFKKETGCKPMDFIYGQNSIKTLDKS